MRVSALRATADFFRFGQSLKRWRMREQFTLKQLAEMTDISLSYISNLERAYAPTHRGQVAPSEAKMEALSRALKVTRVEMYRELGILAEGESSFTVVASGPPPQQMEPAAKTAMLAETNQEIAKLKEQMHALELKYERLAREVEATP